MTKQLRYAISFLLLVGGCWVDDRGAGDPPSSLSSAAEALELSPTVRFNFVKTADWGSGYNARVDVTNIGADAIRGWETGFDMPINVEVQVSLPAAQWSILNTRGIENDVRVSFADSSNVINPGQTQSFFLFGGFRGAFGFPTHCRAPTLDTPVACNESTDATPPSPAGNVRIAASGATFVELAWDAAADDVGVTGYLLQFLTQGAPAPLEIGEVPGTHARITGLTSRVGYQFLVVARDAAGNVAPAASSPVVTTAAPAMSASFATSNQWPPAGFQGAFTVTNTGTEALANWQVDFTFTGQFASSWNGSVVAIAGGPGFRIFPPQENTVLAPGASLAVGVTGAFGSPPANPTGFTFAAGNFGRPLALP